MNKNSPDEMLTLLKQSSATFTRQHDRETAERLCQFMQVMPPEQWDRRLLAVLLVKAGKIAQAKMVADQLETLWQRAEALLRMAETLFESGQEKSALGFLKDAAEAAAVGQRSNNMNDRLDASSVLGEVALAYGIRKSDDVARQLIQQIADPVRKARAEEKLEELRAATVQKEPVVSSISDKAKGSSGSVKKRSSGPKKSTGKDSGSKPKKRSSAGRRK